jgi:hypothetical protein
MQLVGFIEEFETDWRLAGRSVTTGADYARYLRQLADAAGNEPTLRDVKLWLGGRPTVTARQRAQAVRAFGKWAAENEGPDFSWWPRVPLANVAVRAQPTVTSCVITWARTMSCKPSQSDASAATRSRTPSEVVPTGSFAKRGCAD